MRAAYSEALLGMLDQPFMQRAFVAGVAVALLAGAVGYLVVLRAQVFAADALSHVAFTGALGALAIGVTPQLGLFAATTGVAVMLALLGPRGQADDVVIGTVFAWILGLGVLALSIYTASADAANNGGAGVSILFGSIFGLSETTARLTAMVAVLLLLVVLAIVRPLIFASIDPLAAAARGVPVAGLGVIFLAILGATTAAATPAVGALLLLGLIAAPAGTAHRCTRNPFLGMTVSAGLAGISLLFGLTVSYLLPTVPPSSAIIATAACLYLVSCVIVRPKPSARTSQSLRSERSVGTAT